MASSVLYTRICLICNKSLSSLPLITLEALVCKLNIWFVIATCFYEYCRFCVGYKVETVGSINILLLVL